jgi:hypothetical protein
MLRAMGSANFLPAPADRPVGHRGWRALPAFVVTAAALPALAFSSTADDPGWTRTAFLFTAAALIAGGVLLWTARRRAGLGLAAALVVAALAAGVAAEAAQRRDQGEADRWGGTSFTFDDEGPAITRAQAEAVPEGSTKDKVRAILGRAAGSGIQRVNDGTDMRCVVYRDANRLGRNWRLFAFCFSGGRYTDLREW